MHNGDLSASYNIGARSRIREYSKSLCRKAEVVQVGKSSPSVARHQQVVASPMSLVRSVPRGTLFLLCTIQASACCQKGNRHH